MPVDRSYEPDANAQRTIQARYASDPLPEPLPAGHYKFVVLNNGCGHCQNVARNTGLPTEVNGVHIYYLDVGTPEGSAYAQRLGIVIFPPGATRGRYTDDEGNLHLDGQNLGRPNGFPMAIDIDGGRARLEASGSPDVIHAIRPDIVAMNAAVGQAVAALSTPGGGSSVPNKVVTPGTSPVASV